jgi:nicotinamide-nucleotide amidase
MNENNMRQADVPESCRVLTNATGTAPGMWFEKDGTIFISMPGVPYEMKYIMNQHVIPKLNKRFITQSILHRNIMTYGEPEARLAEILSGFESSLPTFIKLAYLPSSGVIKLRLTATGADSNILSAGLDEQIKNLYQIIPNLIFSEREESFEFVIGRLLKESKKTVCTAESCTGGRIANMITSIPGSSSYFKGSVIAYDNSVKTDLLGVSNETLLRYGAVSEQVVVEMAEGIRRKLKTDFAVSTSGIAGPGGGTPEKPVGTVWIGIASEKETITSRHVFGNSRIINIDRFSIAALSMLRRQIINH